MLILHFGAFVQQEGVSPTATLSSLLVFSLFSSCVFEEHWPVSANRLSSKFLDFKILACFGLHIFLRILRNLIFSATILSFTFWTFPFTILVADSSLLQFSNSIILSLSNFDFLSGGTFFFSKSQRDFFHGHLGSHFLTLLFFFI